MAENNKYNHCSGVNNLSVGRAVQACRRARAHAHAHAPVVVAGHLEVEDHLLVGVTGALRDQCLRQQREHVAAQVLQLSFDLAQVPLQHAAFHCVLHQTLGLVQHSPRRTAGAHNILCDEGFNNDGDSNSQQITC